MNKIFAAIGGVIVALLAITVMFGSWYTIDQTERGVLLRNGALVGIVQPGLGFKTPWIESVEKVSVKTSTWTWSKVNSYSHDQQPADMKISVTLHPDASKVGEIYSQFGGVENLVKAVVSPVVNKELKIVFGKYSAIQAIQDRGKLNSEIYDAVSAGLKSYPAVLIDSIQLEDIAFSEQYIHQIEDRMKAEVEVQKLQQQALQAKQQALIAVTQAQARADSVLAEAKANADAVRLRGEADADAIKAKGGALRDNPALIQLTQAERWDGKLPATMIPGAAVPMLGVK